MRKATGRFREIAAEFFEASHCMPTHAYIGKGIRNKVIAAGYGHCIEVHCGMHRIKFEDLRKALEP